MAKYTFLLKIIKKNIYNLWISEMLIKVTLFHNAVGENIIGATKIRNNYGSIQLFSLS